MKVQFYGKNIQLRDNFKEETLKKVQRLDKYFSDEVPCTVTMETIGKQRRVEITIPIPASDTILRADQTSFDMLQSVDQCIAGLVSQVRKYKTKLQKRRQAKDSIRFDSIEDLPEEAQSKDAPGIERVKEIPIRPMNPEEAALQMELLGHDFFLFYNSEIEDMSVIYRRKKGDYGLLLPAKRS